MNIIPSKRFLTALILVIPLLLILEQGGKTVFFVIATAALAIALLEFYNIFINTGIKVQKYFGISIGILISYLFCKNRLKDILPVLVAGIMLASLENLFSKSADELKNNLFSVFINVIGTLYISVLGGYLILIRNMENGLAYIYMLLIIIWGSDSGAYLIGTKFGRNKLSPLISPNKSVEGAIGGIIAGIVGASAWWFLGIFSLLHCISFGILISLAGIAGDLFESLIKRTAKIKDSGILFPGHGGILDRIDSLLFAAPVWYYYINFFLKK